MKTLIITLVMVLSGQAYAACAPTKPRADLLQALEQAGEKVTSRGLALDGELMIEVLTSSNGTWSVILTTPEGYSCLMIYGTDWVNIHKTRGNPS